MFLLVFLRVPSHPVLLLRSDRGLFCSGKIKAELPQGNSLSSVFGEINHCSPHLARAVLQQGKKFMVAQVPESSKVALFFSIKGRANLHSILVLIKQSEMN